MKQTQLFDRQCYKCGEIKPLEKFTRNRKHPTGYQFFCRDCNNKQFRDGYASNPEKYRQRTRNRVTEHPNHYKAKAAVAQALKAGTLVKEPCVKCGCLKVDAHHESYEPDQWLVVVWLCRLHHVERTIEKKQAKEETYCTFSTPHPWELSKDILGEAYDILNQQGFRKGLAEIQVGDFPLGFLKAFKKVEFINTASYCGIPLIINDEVPQGEYWLKNLDGSIEKFKF